MNWHTKFLIPGHGGYRLAQGLLGKGGGWRWACTALILKGKLGGQAAGSEPRMNSMAADRAQATALLNKAVVMYAQLHSNIEFNVDVDPSVYIYII